MRYQIDFWVNLPGGEDFTSFFQSVGPKFVHKGLKPTHMKGILRIR